MAMKLAIGPKSSHSESRLESSVPCQRCRSYECVLASHISAAHVLCSIDLILKPRVKLAIDVFFDLTLISFLFFLWVLQNCPSFCGII